MPFASVKVGRLTEVVNSLTKEVMVDDRLVTMQASAAFRLAYAVLTRK